MVPKVTSKASNIRMACCDIMGFRGPQLFNSLPKQLRNIFDIDRKFFKEKLATHFTTMPEELMNSSVKLHQMGHRQF